MGSRGTGTVSSVREAHVPLRSDSRGVSWASLIGFWWAKSPSEPQAGHGWLSQECDSGEATSW